MNSADLKRLEMASPITQVAVELGIKVRGSVGICFKADTHDHEYEGPTLLFNPVKNSFSCRACTDVGGTVIDLVCQCRGWDRQQAIEWLEHRAEFDRLTHARYHGKGKKK